MFTDAGGGGPREFCAFYGQSDIVHRTKQFGVRKCGSTENRKAIMYGIDYRRGNKRSAAVNRVHMQVNAERCIK